MWRNDGLDGLAWRGHGVTVADGVTREDREEVGRWYAARGIALPDWHAAAIDSCVSLVARDAAGRAIAFARILTDGHSIALLLEAAELPGIKGQAAACLVMEAAQTHPALAGLPLRRLGGPVADAGPALDGAGPLAAMAPPG